MERKLVFVLEKEVAIHSDNQVVVGKLDANRENYQESTPRNVDECKPGDLISFDRFNFESDPQDDNFIIMQLKQVFIQE